MVSLLAHVRKVSILARPEGQAQLPTTFVLLPKPNAVPLPDLPDGYAGGPGAGGYAAAAAADTGGWSTQYDGPGPVDTSDLMVRAADRPYQPRLWR